MRPNSTPHSLRLLLSFIALFMTMGASSSHSISETILASSQEEPTDTGDISPPIENMLDKVNQTKNWQTALGINNFTKGNCTDCLKPVASSRFMTCSAKNDYLEKELSRLSAGETLLGAMIRERPNQNAIIKPVCIEMGMSQKFGVNSRSFKSCNNNGRMTTSFRPCVSENYLRVVQNSFDLVSSCLMGQINPRGSKEEQKKDVRAAYALINIESGFHVNAMSGTGAGGIGQFTGSAIQDVNQNEMRDVRFALSDSQDIRCQQISHELLDTMTPMRADAKNSCDRISLTRGNPLLNMIYTFAHLTSAKKAMDRAVFKAKPYEKKFAMLPASELNKIKRAVMVWAHNSGNSGVWTPTMALLNTVYRNKPVTDADEFIKQMQSYMGKYPATANSSASRRAETSRYFPEITKTLTQIEDNVGGGTCVN